MKLFFLALTIFSLGAMASPEKPKSPPSAAKDGAKKDGSKGDGGSCTGKYPGGKMIGGKCFSCAKKAPEEYKKETHDKMLYKAISELKTADGTTFDSLGKMDGVEGLEKEKNYCNRWPSSKSGQRLFWVGVLKGLFEAEGGNDFNKTCDWGGSAILGVCQIKAKQITPEMKQMGCEIAADKDVHDPEKAIKCCAAMALHYLAKSKKKGLGIDNKCKTKAAEKDNVGLSAPWQVARGIDCDKKESGRGKLTKYSKELCEGKTENFDPSVVASSQTDTGGQVAMKRGYKIKRGLSIFGDN